MSKNIQARAAARAAAGGAAGRAPAASRRARVAAAQALSLPLRAAPQGMMVLARTLKKSISALGMLVRGTSPG